MCACRGSTHGAACGVRIQVHIPSQTLDLLDGDTLVRRYVVSTSRHGLGTEPGSNRTPTGRFRVAEKHGDGAEPGMIFVGRVATGACGREDDAKDHVQTRILWLAGLDEANANTFPAGPINTRPPIRSFDPTAAHGSPATKAACADIGAM